MGLSMPEAVGGLRLTLSAETTDADADAVIAALPRVVDQLRPLTATL
jgi:cysteine sulfinate desulfinase/cysteine desulfurase-like protein